jgi:YD repeat-containing protein
MKYCTALLAGLLMAYGAHAQEIRYSYDALGRVSAVTMQTQNTSYMHDAADNRTQVVQGPNIITGTAAGEWVAGTYFTEQIYGLGGDDIVAGAYGSDTNDGGSGWDQAVYGWFSDYTFVLQPNGSIKATYVPTTDIETITNIEGAWSFTSGDHYPLNYLLTITNTVTGTSGIDVINGVGSGGVDRINALGGDDLIAGNGGHDVIDGGSGFDSVYLGGPIGSYLFRKVTMGTTPEAAVQAIYLPTNESELWISIEQVNISGVWYAINDLPY